MGGAPQPNAKGKFTRSGRVLGRSTPDVNDHYDFHEVRFKPNPPLDARAPSPLAERVSRLSRFASRTLADVSLHPNLRFLPHRRFSARVSSAPPTS